MMNSVNARPKRSSLEIATGMHIILTFCILCVLCLFCCIAYSVLNSHNAETVKKYMLTEDTPICLIILVRIGN